MKMDRRLSNGLAWAGALLVIGIPAADYLTGAFANTGAPSVAVVDADPVAPASVVPPVAVKPAGQGAEAPKPVARPQAVANASDPVAGFLQSGKQLPDYITGGGTPAAKPQVAAPKPIPATTAPATTPPPVEQVAALPAKVAPTPMPLSMRPRPVSVPLVNSQPLIINDAATGAAVPMPPQQPAEFVTSEDLEAWESGPLNEFLARRGQQSSATYQVQQNAPVYDTDGFWLDEGPGRNRPVGRKPRGDDEVYYLPF
jgi:hypothetical protein